MAQVVLVGSLTTIQNVLGDDLSQDIIATMV